MAAVPILLATLQLLPFKVDVTPPAGVQMAYAENKPGDTRIFIRGVVLDDGRTKAVIASCDYLYIWGQTWFDWRKAIAKSAGTMEDHVFLHSIHQHDSMRITPQWNEYARRFGKETVSDGYCKESLDKLCRTIEDGAAQGRWRVAAKLLTAERRIWGLASNRRMLDDQGKCFAMRYSMCDSPELKALPTGVIDPFLRTIAFAETDGRLIAALHFYASHPMAAYKTGRVAQDVPGVALACVEEALGQDALNIYFTGCGGNVSFGKYHLGCKKESLELLGRRLGEGMVANLKRLEERPMGRLTFAEARFEFPLNPKILEPSMREQALQGEDGKPVFSAISRTIIAENWSEWRNCRLYRLSFDGKTHMLSLPSEMCVEYQLYAQSLVPEQFLACAAYGNGSYHYIPTAKMFEEGGYEPGASITTPEIEGRLKPALDALLKDVR